MERHNGPVIRGKKLWSPEMHEYFVDLCVQETLNGNKPGPSFNRDGWNNVLEALNKKPNFNIDKKQLKNHWDLTRQKWKAWCKLLGTSSMKWEPTTRKFGASQEDWANYIKFNPEAAIFQYKELEFVDKLEIVFPGITTATEAEGTEPAAQRRKLDDSPSNLHLCTEDKDKEESQILPPERMEQSDTLELKPRYIQPKRIEHHFEGVELRPRDLQPKRIDHLYETVELRPREIQPKRIEHLCEPVGLSALGTPPRRVDNLYEAVELRPKDIQPKRIENLCEPTKLSPLYTQPKELECPCDALESRHKDTQPEKVDQRQCDTVESRSAMTIQSKGGDRIYSIGECIECLDGMEDIEQGGELYLFALDLFLRKEYREIFLQLKKPAVKIAWLKRLQSIGFSP